jgi:hypothetical protein
MRSKLLNFGLALAVAATLVGCNSSSSTPIIVVGPQNLYVADRTTGKIFVYSLASGIPTTPAVTLATGFSTLYDAQFDASGRLFVINDVTPSVIYGYNLPLTPSSMPVVTLTINGSSPTNTDNAFSFTFDPSGNLWVADNGNNRLLGYHGPFSGTMTPTAFTTIAVSLPWNVISDPTGNLYVASGTHVVRMNAPPSGANATLSSLSEPIAMQLDASGNLYVGDFGNGNLLRYNAPINDGATPAILDPQVNTTLSTSYYMALDRTKLLYVGDCSSSVKIFDSSAFSVTSGPVHTLTLPAGATCSTGVAIR